MGVKTDSLPLFLRLSSPREVVRGVDLDPNLEGRLRARLDAGEEKYGPDSWLNHDMGEEAQGELDDLVNYLYLRWLGLGMEPGDPAPLVRARTGLELIARDARWLAERLRAVTESLDRAGVGRSVSGADLVGAPGPGGRG